MSPALGPLARRAFRAAWVLALLAVACWVATNLVAGHAVGLPGPTLEDCGPPGERAQTCTADQLLWEDRELIALAVAVAATAAAAIAAVTAATAAVVRDVLARRPRA
ncbi:hypothetical protein [Patulibacter sp. SYSU D01012]|uniref:hypothetical protein n=1 Tax=Patulibacter sp. SYSU D01012 TaxID=2817381 RepID=UPI001B30D56F|nr:hypothetical protein [Patulibacter sp. SYSU D01012]